MKPPKSVWPSADQERETHSGSRAPALCAKSGLSSSTIDLQALIRNFAVSTDDNTYLLSRSKILMQVAVAAHNQ